jgi:hypothetical protein
MYRHTFYLYNGETKVTYSPSEDIGHISFGDEVAFIAYENNMRYTIPFTSVGYIESEVLDEEQV